MMMPKNISGDLSPRLIEHYNKYDEGATAAGKGQQNSSQHAQPESLRASLEKQTGKIRSRKQWDAYQKLVAYYNHQKTVNASFGDTFDIATTFTGGGGGATLHKKMEAPKSITKRDSTLDLQKDSLDNEKDRVLPSVMKDTPVLVVPLKDKKDQ